VLERSAVLRSVRTIRPKSPRRAVPARSTRTLAYDDCQRCEETVRNVGAHPFEIAMSDPEFVKECDARGYLVKLWVVTVYQRGIPRGMYDRTRQTQAVGLWVGTCVFHDISVGHPLRDDAEISGAF